MATNSDRNNRFKRQFCNSGFIDNHVHFISGGLQLSRVNLNDVLSKKEFQARIIEFDRVLQKFLDSRGNWDHELWRGYTQINLGLMK